MVIGDSSAPPPLLPGFLQLQTDADARGAKGRKGIHIAGAKSIGVVCLFSWGEPTVEGLIQNACIHTCPRGIWVILKVGYAFETGLYELGLFSPKKSNGVFTIILFAIFH